MNVLNANKYVLRITTDGSGCMKKRFLILIFLLALTVFTLSACGTFAEDKRIISVEIESFANYSLYQGDELNLTGAKLRVYYDDNSVEVIDIEREMLSGYDKNKVGTQTVRITCGAVSETAEINVLPLEIQSIELYAAPNNFSVVQGGELDVSGIAIKINYQNKFVILEKITRGMIKGYSASLQPGDHTVTIEYSGFTVPITLTVIEKSIVSISVKTVPDKRQYFQNEETLLPQGLAITVLYDNGSYEDITYSDVIASRFAFSYNFSAVIPASPVTVTYLGEFTAKFTVAVTYPVCTRMAFETVDPQGNKKYTYPVSYSGRSITTLVEGDSINWATGSAHLFFDDGSEMDVALNDSNIYVLMQNPARPTELLDVKSQVYHTPGNFILNIRYANSSFTTPLYVEVHAKTAEEMLLYNTDIITSIDYVEGDTVKIDPIKYNIRYDNGTYLFDYEDKSLWRHLSLVMLSEGSTVVCSYNALNEGRQTISVVSEGVTASIVVNVKPLTVNEIMLTEPTNNYVKKGATAVDLSGGGLYVKYNNNTSSSIGLSFDMVKYYKGTNVSEENRVESFTETGEYTVLITYGDLTAGYIVTASEALPTSIAVKDLPSSAPVFSDFSDIDFNSIKLLVYYEDQGAPTEISANEVELYSYEGNVTGEQTLVFRYFGKTAEYRINVIGRVVNSIEVQAGFAGKTLYAPGETYTPEGLRVIRRFSDGTTSTKEFSGYEVSGNTLWSFILPEDMNTLGDKVVIIRYLGADVKDIELPITVGGEVLSISFNASDADNAKRLNTESRLLVTKNQDINTTGLYIDVLYAGLNEAIRIPLLSGYVSYDKNYDSPNPTRELTISYGGKEAKIEIETVERVLVGIEITENPDCLVYVNGQPLNLKGGYITRTYNDGTQDIVSMDRGDITNDYIENIFDNIVGTADISYKQTVTFTMDGVSTAPERALEITTFKKTGANADITYSDTVSFYGNVKTPRINIYPKIQGFEAPLFELFYKVNGEWVKERPSIPGRYPLRVSVIENEYYLGGDIEEQSLIIIQKIIEIRANNATKFYSEEDPTFTYWTEGDTIVDGVTVNNVLIYNDGVQDKIEIRLVREPGENVQYTATNTLKPYKIRYELVDGDNQNSRYIIQFVEGDFTIAQMTITETLNFSGVNGLVADGTQKFVSVSYVRNGANVLIPASDIIYYNNSTGEKLESAPWVPGTYRAEVSGNYNVEGVREVVFTINER